MKASTPKFPSKKRKMANENHMFHSKGQKKCVLCVVMWLCVHTKNQQRVSIFKVRFLKYGKYLEPKKKLKNKVQWALSTHWFSEPPCCNRWFSVSTYSTHGLVGAAGWSWGRRPAPGEDVLWGTWASTYLGIWARSWKQSPQILRDPFIQHDQAFWNKPHLITEWLENLVKQW